MTDVPTYEFGNDVRLSATFEGSPALADVRLYVRAPEAPAPTVYSGAQLTDDGGGEFSRRVLADAAGAWFWTMSVESGTGSAAVDGTFIVDPSEARTPGVTDQRDVRVMIPQVRRALDGPEAETAVAAETTLSDEQVTGLIADSIGDVILLTGNVFGKNLEVTSRDLYYLAPDGWQTSEELSDAEQRVIVAQAAINQFMQVIKTLKVSEKIADEGQEWQYTLSATLVKDQLKFLQDMRDRALEALSADNVVPDAYFSFVRERDVAIADLIGVEEWSDGSRSSGGGQVLDPRGFC